MKFSVNWLKQWVATDMDANGLARKLTASGLEVDSVEPVAAPFDGVVVAEIKSCESHPDADKLSLCSVNDGGGELLQIVCGAPNARPGIRVPLARVGARLGEDFNIKRAKLRGIESNGMLCSARELGLSEDHTGLMELPSDAPIGEDFRHWLSLDDSSIEIDLTPNRADCLSIKGLAQDVAASCEVDLIDNPVQAVAPAIQDSIAITLADPDDCPRYVGRIIRNANAAVETPMWMQESLRRCGVRSISPVVDVTNFVLLERGQPMHAFDLDRLNGGITVRRGRPGESLELLDGSTVDLDDSVLAICDDSGPVALAGIMGGEQSSVTDATTNLLLESAWFKPATIMGKARAFGKHTDASHRFERGVDPQGQVEAIERATQLLTEICGGEAGPVLDEVVPGKLPEARPVTLRLERLNRLVGLTFDADRVEGILRGLGMQVEPKTGGWTVTAPSSRVDIECEEDLIEEVARIHGYDQIPEAPVRGQVSVGTAASHQVPQERLLDVLCAAGYQEAITYSFVDQRDLEKFHLAEQALPLANPLSADMDVMRTSLVPGLLAALDYNVRRQQGRVRLFETGVAYLQGERGLTEVPRVAAVACGSARPEQWAEPTRPIDFFDIKGEVEQLLRLRGMSDASFLRTEARWAHPGASASIRVDGESIGWCGALHPEVLQRFDIDYPVLAFELDQDALLNREIPFAKNISRFPYVRRDLAIWIPDKVTYTQIKTCIVSAAGEWLQNLVLFDVYHDENLKKGYKSLAIGLILQNISSTLTDELVGPVIQQVISELNKHLGATLRG